MLHYYHMHLPRLLIAQSQINGLKWAAVLLMTIDHVNKLLLSANYEWMYNVGRISMPLFAIALGLNMANARFMESMGYRRLTMRLLVIGLISTPAFIVVNQPLIFGWLPLNIMFTLLCGVVIAWCFETKSAWGIPIASVVMTAGVLLVEFWWPAVFLMLSVWSYQKKPNIGALILFALSLLALYWVNANWWALAVIPVVFLLFSWETAWPRAKWFFYLFYPSHLYLIWLIREFY